VLPLNLKIDTELTIANELLRFIRVWLFSSRRLECRHLPEKHLIDAVNNTDGADKLTIATNVVSWSLRR
jgi:hypothetical protein